MVAAWVTLSHVLGGQEGEERLAGRTCRYQAHITKEQESGEGGSRRASRGKEEGEEGEREGGREGQGVAGVGKKRRTEIGRGLQQGESWHENKLERISIKNKI